MKRIPGVIASGGVISGPSYWYEQPEIKYKKTVISDTQAELERYRKAIKQVKEDLDCLGENFKEGAAIFEIQNEFISDPSFGLLIEEKIISDSLNAEYIVGEVSDELAKEFSEIEDEYFSQRALDVHDLATRILKTPFRNM